MERLLGNCTNCSTAQTGFEGVVEELALITELERLNDPDKIRLRFEDRIAFAEELVKGTNEIPCAPTFDFIDELIDPRLSLEERVEQSMRSYGKQIADQKNRLRLAEVALGEITLDCPGPANPPEGKCDNVQAADLCQSPMRYLWE